MADVIFLCLVCFSAISAVLRCFGKYIVLSRVIPFFVVCKLYVFNVNFCEIYCGLGSDLFLEWVG